LLNAALQFYISKSGGIRIGRIGGRPWLVLALMLIWAGSAQAAAPSPLQRPPALKAKEATYITDVTGKRVRIVGPRFYPNPTKILTFPGRGASSPDRPKR
jgi:hypothetical protein